MNMFNDLLKMYLLTCWGSKEGNLLPLDSYKKTLAKREK